MQLLLIGVGEILCIREGRRFEHAVFMERNRSNIMRVVIVVI